MTEEEKKTIEDYKRVIAMYFKYSDYDLFCSNLMKSGVKGTIQNTMADMINLIEKLQKENKEYKLLNANIEKANRIIEGKEEYIPKNKIREKLEKIEKEKEQYYAAGQHLMYMLLKNQLKSLLEEE